MSRPGSDLPALLAALDPDALRAGPEAMHEALRRVACDVGWDVALPDLVGRLALVGRVDLCLGRLVEGHADAVRILGQGGRRPRDGVYGVWASRSAGTGVRARRDGDGWRLDGELRFASGVDLIDRSLVPVWLDDRTHVLLDLPVGPGAGPDADGVVTVDRDTWWTAAMDASRSFTVRLAATVPDPVAPQVGPEGFYLDRPGFVAGGLGPAAVWLGGARALLDAVTTGLRRFPATAHQRRRLGAADQAVWQAGLLLAEVARRADADPAGAADDVVAVRTAVVEAADRVAEEAPRIVGPGGLTGDVRLARTLADLAVYVRQHHLDLTLEARGSRLLDAGAGSGE